MLPAPSATVPARDPLSFYPRASSVLESPPDLARYGIECSVPIKGGYFTLAIRDDKREALLVLTEKPVTSLAKVVSFGGDPKKSQDWGFVYDRNGDGWADYIAFLDGAMAVTTPEAGAGAEEADARAYPRRGFVRGAAEADRPPDVERQAGVQPLRR